MRQGLGMLWVGKRREKLRELSPSEKRRLILAFGRDGGAAVAREEAKSVVAAAQNGGQWFFCACNADQNTVLVPYERTYVHRRVASSNAHSDRCPFAVDPVQQLAIVRSMRPHPPEKAFNLLSDFASDRGPLDEDRTAQFNTVRRSKLARVLIALAEASGLQTQDVGTRSINLQFNDLISQAKNFKLVGEIPLASMLCTYPPKLGEFLGDFNRRAARFNWPRGSRAHGIVIMKLICVENRNLVFSKEVKVPVSGPIAIFGRSDAPRLKDRPYIGIGLIAKQSATSPAEVIRAYIHPCYSHENLMLVDSNYERETFDYLRDLQSEYAGRVDFKIEKPLSDIGQRFQESTATDAEVDNQEIDAHGAPPILIPDFVVRFKERVRSDNDFFVETMGFSSQYYRAIKRRIIPEMRRALGGILHVEHDFYFPSDLTLDERHEIFRKAVRDKINKSSN
ncbi:hypothetical protein [Rhizobium sp. BR 249]|uniref:hypothetical protein n=1 Tax=Rhizobium sp. BR 249 TaxID=3040011 RepID=UPI0039BFDAF5